MTAKSYEKRAARELQASLALKYGADVSYCQCLDLVRADIAISFEPMSLQVRVDRLVASFEKKGGA